MKNDLDLFHENVPGDYYDRALRYNILQRFWHTRRFREVKDLLSRIEPRKILDVGCHGGLFTNEIAGYYKQSAICGIDISPSAIKFARSKYRSKIRFGVGRAERIPYPNDSFDLVTCLEVMEHVDNPTEVVGEIKRVLKEKGHFIVLVPTENLLFKIIWFFWSRFGPGKIWKHTHVQEFINHSLDKLLIKHGFEIANRKSFLLGMLLLIHARKI